MPFLMLGLLLFANFLALGSLLLFFRLFSGGCKQH